MSFPPPENVALIRNGERIPLDVEFDGVRDDGTAVFLAVGETHMPGDHLAIGTLPPLTSVVFTIRPRELPIPRELPHV